MPQRPPHQKYPKQDKNQPKIYTKQVVQSLLQKMMPRGSLTRGLTSNRKPRTAPAAAAAAVQAVAR